MSKRAKSILQKPYQRVFIPDEVGTYCALILEFPGCISQGDTIQDALANLENAAVNWIDASLRAGHVIPEPEVNKEYGGKVLLRMPKSLHARAAQRADMDGVSINTFIVAAVAHRVGSLDLYGSLLKEVKRARKR